MPDRERQPRPPERERKPEPMPPARREPDPPEDVDDVVDVIIEDEQQEEPDRQ